MMKERILKNTVFILYFLLLLPYNSPAQNHEALEQLLAPFSKTQHIKIAYEEKRFSLFFKSARVYQGYIEYISPDTFIKYIEKPNRKKIIIKQEQLSLYQYHSQSPSEPSEKKEVSLNDYPQFKQLKALFSGLFKGQTSKLTQYYRYSIHPLTSEQTRLTLNSLISDAFTQSEQQRNNQSQTIEIIFQNEHIRKITMIGFGGERSELNFGEILFIERINEPIKDIQ